MWVFLNLFWFCFDFCFSFKSLLCFPGGSEGKESASSAGHPGLTPGSRRSLENGTTTHSSILAWKIPWTKEPGGLQSMCLLKTGHNWATNTFTFSSLSSLTNLSKQISGYLNNITEDHNNESLFGWYKELDCLYIWAFSFTLICDWISVFFLSPKNGKRKILTYSHD